MWNVSLPSAGEPRFDMRFELSYLISVICASKETATVFETVWKAKKSFHYSCEKVWKAKKTISGSK